MTGTDDTNGIPILDDESFAHVWQLIGYSIVDVRGRKMGPVARVWTDGDSHGLAFVGLNTGRVWRQSHVIPARDARIIDANRTIRVSYRGETILAAPHHNTDVPLSGTQQRRVDAYYGLR